MRRLVPTLAAVIMAIAVAAPAQAQSQNARWISRWDLGECQLIRAIDNAERLAFKITPGTGVLTIWARSTSDVPLPAGSRRRARVIVLPSGAVADSADVQWYQNEGDDIYVVAVADEPTLRELASGRSLRLTVNDVEIVAMPLGNIAAGVDVLRQCVSDQLRTWGIDPAALSSLRERPVPLHEAGLAGYLSSEDYPFDAMRRGATGATIVRLDVGTHGRVSDCSVLQSSGDSALDQASCRSLMRRARFRPARDASGRPTSAPVVTQIYWHLRG